MYSIKFIKLNQLFLRDEYLLATILFIYEFNQRFSVLGMFQSYVSLF